MYELSLKETFATFNVTFFSGINQDDVRKAIGPVSGKQIKVDMINRCKFRSSDPKFIVQLAKTTNREVLESEGIIRRVYCPSPNKPDDNINGLGLYENCFQHTFYLFYFLLRIKFLHLLSGKVIEWSGVYRQSIKDDGCNI